MKHLKRVKLNPPTMNKYQRAWMAKVIRSQYWRVAHWYDLEDLAQDGFMCFAKVVNRYPRVHNEAHIGKLFQITFLNHLHNLANQRRKGVPETPSVQKEAELLWEYPLSLPTKVPPRVAKVLSLFADEKKRRQVYKGRPFQEAETAMNIRMCKLLKLDPLTVDLVGETKAYLMGN